MALSIYLDADYDGPLPVGSSATNRVYQDLSVLAGKTADAANFICTYRPPREYCWDIDFFVTYLNIICLSYVISDFQQSYVSVTILFVLFINDIDKACIGDSYIFLKPPRKTGRCGPGSARRCGRKSVTDRLYSRCCGRKMNQNQNQKSIS